MERLEGAIKGMNSAFSLRKDCSLLEIIFTLFYQLSVEQTLILENVLSTIYNLHSTIYGTDMGRQLISKFVLNCLTMVC